MDLNEDGLAPIATNNIGGGAIQGAGIGPQGEPGVYLKKRKLGPIMSKVIQRGRIRGFKEFTNGGRTRRL